jgi:predicted dehydrogenase
VNDAAPVRVGLVGLGYWGPNLARNFDRLPGAELRWCCDRSEEALHRHRPHFPSARFTDRLDDLLADPDTDAIVLATSTCATSPAARVVSSWSGTCCGSTRACASCGS